MASQQHGRDEWLGELKRAGHEQSRNISDPTERRTWFGRDVEIKFLWDLNSHDDGSDTMNPEKIIESIRRDSAENADGAQLILDWWREDFGEPRCTDKGNCIVADLKSIAFTPFALQQYGKQALYVYLDNIRATSPFDVDENWREFRRRLDGISGAHWSETDKRRFASARLSAFRNADTRNAFFELVNWTINEVTAAK